MRCVLHASLYDDNCFLTLTYDEEKNGYINQRIYSHIQDFKKNLRRYCDYHFQKRIQIFNVHEYGRNGKKHWHLVVFNHDFEDKILHTIKNGHSLYRSDVLSEKWKYGFHTIGNVTLASAMYQSQYMQKDLQYGHRNSPRQCHSKHSGIGRDYFLQNYRQILTLGYVPFAGRKIPIPRYFEKLALKHYSHFHVPENFEDTTYRKKLFTKFKPGEANEEISDLYRKYYDAKQIKVAQLTEEWESFIEDYIYNDEKTDFVKTGENLLYDLKNKLDDKPF